MLECLRKQGAGPQPQGAGAEQTARPTGVSNQAMLSMLGDQREQQSAHPASGGQPLDDAMRAKFERQFGLPMDDVRVHYNSSQPVELDALAYTQGSEIFVAPGQEVYLQHELNHVVQQKLGMVQPNTSIQGLPLNDSPSLEQSADHNRLPTMKKERKRHKPVIQRMRFPWLQDFHFTQTGTKTHMNYASRPQGAYFTNCHEFSSAAIYAYLKSQGSNLKQIDQLSTTNGISLMDMLGSKKGDSRTSAAKQKKINQQFRNVPSPAMGTFYQQLLKKAMEQGYAEQYHPETHKLGAAPSLLLFVDGYGNVQHSMVENSDGVWIGANNTSSLGIEGATRIQNQPDNPTMVHKYSNMNHRHFANVNEAHPQGGWDNDHSSTMRMLLTGAACNIYAIPFPFLLARDEPDASLSLRSCWPKRS